jgi:hypothetical protein
MKNSILIFSLLLAFTSSCRKSGVPSYQLNDVKKDIILKHSEDAYEDLVLSCDNDTTCITDQLGYDLIMSRDTGVTLSYSCENFFCNYITTVNGGKFDKNAILKLDKPEQDFLIYKLTKGALRKSSTCRAYLYYYYINGIGVKKDSLKADSLIKLESSERNFKITVSNLD